MHIKQPARELFGRRLLWFMNLHSRLDQRFGNVSRKSTNNHYARDHFSHSQVNAFQKHNAATTNIIASVATPIH